MPPGVGRPACVSAARLAAFGPTFSGSAAAGSESGRMMAVMRFQDSTLPVARRAPSPRLRGEGWGEGQMLTLRIAEGPLTRTASRSDLSPHAGRGEAHFT